jgi:hypothetical protein
MASKSMGFNLSRGLYEWLHDFFFKIATLKILLQQPRGRDSSWLFLLRENVALETGLPAEAIATKVLAGCESLATLKILFTKWDLIKGQSCYSGIFFVDLP